jgi:hypothetical protein
VVGLQSGGETVEVTTIPRQTMDADNDVWVAHIAPVGIGDAMEAVGTKAEKTLLGQGHGF